MSAKHAVGRTRKPLLLTLSAIGLVVGLAIVGAVVYAMVASGRQSGGGTAPASSSSSSSIPPSTSAAPTSSSAAPSTSAAPTPSPSQSSSSQIMPTPVGVYTLDGGEFVSDGESYKATQTDESAIFVTNAGALNLSNSTVETSGDASLTDASDFFGVNAAILANALGKIVAKDGSVTTSGLGANAVFAYGAGTSIQLTGTTIEASGRYSHGIMAAGGGSVSATDVEASTSGDNASVIATDRGGGVINVSGGSYTTSGVGAPGVYSTGDIGVTGSSITAKASESIVIEGSNSIDLADTTATSSAPNKWGVLIFQSTPFDALGAQATFIMNGGELSNTADVGPLFYVTNAAGTITLSGVKVSAKSNVFLSAKVDQWGTAGSNGGHATVKANGQALAGDILADAASSVDVRLSNASTWIGALNPDVTAKVANVALDASSSWTLTADSHVMSLKGAVISGSEITNITGGGHNLTYDKTQNPDLGGKTYTLAGGGSLLPAL